MSDFQSVSPVERKPQQQVRATQQTILPTAVKNRQFGNIVLMSGVKTGVATLNNNSQVVFTITTQTMDNQRILCVPDISVFIGSIDFDNQLPGGASVDEADWDIIFMQNDYASTDNQNTKTIVFVQNISAGTQDVILVTQSRLIENITAISANA